MKKLIIFDLDGTLIDSVVDIQDSMNKILEKNDLKIFSKEQYISFIGKGSKILTKEVLEKNDIFDNEVLLDKVHKQYLAEYQTNCINKTKEYENVSSTLRHLKGLGIKLAILTNKPHLETITIVERFFPNIFDYVLGKTDNTLVKPHSQGLKIIIKHFNISKKDILYVGDSTVDAVLANNNKLENVICSYGYNNQKQLNEFLLNSKNKNHIIYNFSEIKNLIFDNKPFKTQFISKKLSYEEVDDIYTTLKEKFNYNGFEYFYFEDSLDYQEKVKRLLEKFSPDYLVMHLPFESNRLNLSSNKEEVRLKSIELVKEAIDWGVKNNTFRFVFHSGFYDEDVTKEKDLIFYLQFARSLKELVEYTENSKVILLMENLISDSEITNTAQNLNMFLVLVKNYRLKITLDLGHANVAHLDSIKFIKKHHKDIFHFHFNNNYGDKDSHSSLENGNIDYEKIVKTLKKLNYKNSISIETGWEKEDIIKNNEFLKNLNYY